jgi:hypothetical protein
MKKTRKKNLALVKNIYLSPLKNPDPVSVLKSLVSLFLLGLVASFIGLELIAHTMITTTKKQKGAQMAGLALNLKPTPSRRASSWDCLSNIH